MNFLDREKDPLEVRDFYKDPAYAEIVKQLQAELQRQRTAVGDTADPPREAFGTAPFDNEPRPPAAGKKATKKAG